MLAFLLAGNLMSEVTYPKDYHGFDRSENTDQQDRIALGQNNEEQEEQP